MYQGENVTNLNAFDVVRFGVPQRVDEEIQLVAEVVRHCRQRRKAFGHAFPLATFSLV